MNGSSTVDNFVSNFIKNQNEVTIEFDNEDDYMDFFEHHGVDGQKWGARRGPPYPLTKEAKKKDPTKVKASKKAEREVDKAKKKQENERKKEEKTKADYERKKNKYSKTAKTLYKHRDMYTKEEIQKILERFGWEEKIKNYAASDLQRAKDKVNTFKDFASSIADIANSGVKIYNVVAKVHNVSDPSDSKWTLIEENKQNKNTKGGNQ